MAKSHKFDIQKAVFQVRYKPNLGYYNHMYNHSDLFSDYNNWETDRLRLTFRNFDSKESIVIRHDSIGYETDEFKQSKVEEGADLINEYIKETESDDSITRLGYRTWALCPVEMDFNDLKEILNLKLFNLDFLKLSNNDPTDLTVTIVGEEGDLKYRMMIGPMRNVEVPNYISYNTDNHIDPNSVNKYTEVAKIYSSYPEVSFFMDLDIYKAISKDSKIGKDEIENFKSDSIKLMKDQSKKLLNHIFTSKL